jgi:arabinogalactan oligomer/maltooligosaccharide transport system permease protein
MVEQRRIALVFVLPRQEDEKRARLIYFGVAGVLLIAGLFWFTGSQIDAFRDYRNGIETQIAEHFTSLRQQAESQSATHGLGLQVAENVWDTDAFRRPLNYITVDGALNPSTIDNSLTTSLKPLRNTLIGNGILGFLLLAFFGLGLALRFWSTLVENRTAYGYITPALIGMVILVFFPFFYGIALSFTGQTLYNTDQPLTDIWIGFENYADILFDFNLRVTTDTGERVWNYENFYWTLFITVCWTVGNVAIGVSVGLALALCLNTKTLKGKPIYRAILILPWAIPNYVTALIWKGLFHKQFGPINQIIQMFGGEPVSWFDNVFTSFITGLTVNGWLSFPFMMVISLGALQSISQDMYEAARLDGASRFQQFRFITLPSLKPALVPAIIISVVWTFNMFNIIYLVSGGEPAGANEILVTKAYKIAFEKYQYGYAAAYATVIFFILRIYGIFQTKRTPATEDLPR